MRTRQVLTMAAILGGLIVSVHPLAAEIPAETPSANKDLVIDGHVRHTVGALDNHVTNWGLIGSRPTVPTPFSLAPSARWGGIDYLWGAGVWFGGTVLGEPLVTTGQYESEFMSSEAPGDTIFATAQGAPNGARYPWPGADDDGDGAEDEDPLDGLDNDSDGLIDEDFAAASEQNFSCSMADNYQEILDIYPDHTPLNLEIVQRSFQWANPIGEDFIGYEYRVTNAGVANIDGFHCGIFADFDIELADDDHAGSWGLNGGLVRGPWGNFYPVRVGWMRDGAETGTAPGIAGFVLCGLGIESGGETSFVPPEMQSFQIFSGFAPFEQGGDPTNDTERYQLLSYDGWDPDSSPVRESDYRFLMSTEEIAIFAPGETVIFQMALVIGQDMDDLLLNAAAAMATAEGVSFDRDGDPANGKEFRVPWLMPDEVPVPAVTGRLQANPGPGPLSLVFEVRHLSEAQVEVERRAAPGVPFRAWSLAQSSGSFTDEEDVGWPRTYDLKLKAAGSPDLVLDTVEVPGPVVQALRMEASPNPFNPRLTISYSLPASGPARLEILDVQGRLVRVLFDEARGAGADRVDWNGEDERGRAAASGVYLVRLVSGNKAIRQQVTLVR